VRRRLLPVLLLSGGVALAQITGPLQQSIPDMTPPSGRVATPSMNNDTSRPALGGLTDIWSGLGTGLRAACSFFEGQPLNLNLNGIPVKIPVVGRWTPELAWICDASKTWGIINGIVHQDWAQFAAEVAGQWIGDLVTVLATSMGIEVGSVGWSSQIADLNDKLRRSYSEFSRAIRNVIWNAARASLDKARAEKRASAAQRLPPSQANNPTALKIEEITKRVEGVTPTKTLAAYTAIEDNIDAEKRAQAATSLDRSQKALTSVSGEKGTVASLMNKESAYLGIRDPFTGQYVIDPTTGQPVKGLINETLGEAAQAPDTRTAVEVLTKMVGHVVAVELYGSRAIVETVAALVTQLDATNHMLAQMIADQGSRALRVDQQVRQEIREAAGEATLEVFTAEAAGEGIIRINELVFQTDTPRTDY
jgi:hypothetical protein